MDRDIPIGDKTAEPERVNDHEVYQLKDGPEQNYVAINPEVATEFWFDLYQIV